MVVPDIEDMCSLLAGNGLWHVTRVGVPRKRGKRRN